VVVRERGVGESARRQRDHDGEIGPAQAHPSPLG
jgi:hypothetical protein